MCKNCIKICENCNRPTFFQTLSVQTDQAGVGIYCRHTVSATVCRVYEQIIMERMAAMPASGRSPLVDGGKFASKNKKLNTRPAVEYHENSIFNNVVHSTQCERKWIVRIWLMTLGDRWHNDAISKRSASYQQVIT